MRPGGVSQGGFLECILFVLHSELFFEVDLPAYSQFLTEYANTSGLNVAMLFAYAPLLFDDGKQPVPDLYNFVFEAREPFIHLFHPGLKII